MRALAFSLAVLIFVGLIYGANWLACTALPFPSSACEATP